MAFTPRTTAPSYSDLRWIQVGSGGYNQCIYGSDGPPSVLPDCTGYVHGRIMEIRGVNTDDCGLSFGDGVTYWTNSSSIWEQSQNPSLGAVLCYYTNTSGDGHPGHVAIVEEVIDNDTVIVSESNYGGVRWERQTCYRRYGWRPDATWNVTAQGFLKNPWVDDEPGPGPGGSLPAVMLLLMKKATERLKGNVRLRRI